MFVCVNIYIFRMHMFPLATFVVYLIALHSTLLHLWFNKRFKEI